MGNVSVERDRDQNRRDLESLRLHRNTRPFAVLHLCSANVDSLHVYLLFMGNLPVERDADENRADIKSLGLHRDARPFTVLHLCSANTDCLHVYLLFMGDLPVERNADQDGVHDKSFGMHGNSGSEPVLHLYAPRNAYADAGPNILHHVPRPDRKHNRVKVRRIYGEREKRIQLADDGQHHDGARRLACDRLYRTGLRELPVHASLIASHLMERERRS